MTDLVRSATMRCEVCGTLLARPKLYRAARDSDWFCPLHRTAYDLLGALRNVDFYFNSKEEDRLSENDKNCWQDVKSAISNAEGM